MFFLRDLFRSEGVMSCAEINTARDGARAKCADIVLTQQMPGDAGVVHLVPERVFDRSYELHRLSDDQMQALPVSTSHNHPRNMRTVPKSRDFH